MASRVGTLWLSAPSLLDDDLEAAARLIDATKPRGFRGYPWVLVEFGRWAARTGYQLPSTVAAVMFSSEVMIDWQQHLIQHVLKRPLYGLYGQAERVVIAGWCEHSHYYHFVPGYGVVELVDTQGAPV